MYSIGQVRQHNINLSVSFPLFISKDYIKQFSFSRDSRVTALFDRVGTALLVACVKAPIPRVNHHDRERQQLGSADPVPIRSKMNWRACVVRRTLTRLATRSADRSTVSVARRRSCGWRGEMLVRYLHPGHHHGTHLLLSLCICLLYTSDAADE